LSRFRKSAGSPLRPLFTDGAARLETAQRTLRVILVSQYFSPEIGATQTRMQAFAEYLAARGHQVTVICEFPNHPHGVMPTEYRGRLIEDDRSNPYRIIRVWVKATPEKTRATRLAFYLSYMTLATAVAPLAGRADVVVATTPPLFAGAAGLAIARIAGARFVLDVRDLWPAAAVSLNELAPGAALRAAEWVERLLYRQAHTVVGVTRPFCDHIDRIRGKSPKAVFIPNGTLEMFFSNDTSEGRRRLGVSEDRFAVTFAGTHGIAQALPSVLDAARRVNGEVQFVFIGDGPVKAALEREADTRQLENVLFQRQLPLEQLPPILAASDALLVPMAADPVFSSFIPSKVFDYLATGRPVILSARGESAEILERAAGGLAVEPENPEALASAVNWLAQHPWQAREMGENGRRFARNWSRLVQAERVEQVLLHVHPLPLMPDRRRTTWRGRLVWRQ
jgi:glycosyltransferase involved in cell wall biosynthesis